MKKFLAVLCVLVCPTFASAQAITGVGASAVTSGNDFATKAFQDPWDMNERTDIGWFVHGVDQPGSGLENPNFALGQFSATTVNQGPNIFLLETGNPNAARIGKIGTNFPINADTHKYIAFRMSVGTPSFVQFIWNRDTIYDATTTTGFNVQTTSGYRIYLVDLTSLTTNGANLPWSGLMRALRMNLSFAPAGDPIAIDWVRLVDAGTASTCRTITWTGAGTVDLYVTDLASNNLGKIASSVSAGQASPGCATVGGGYTYYAGALAPGNYRVGISPPGGTAPTSTFGPGTSWVVNDIPTLTFTSPDPEGSTDDFATTFLNDPWDMNALTDLDLITNVTSPQIRSDLTFETPAGASLGTQTVFFGTSVSAAASGSIVGDPYVNPLFTTKRGFNGRIDTNRYRVLTLEMGIPNAPRDILNGSIARIVWRVAGESGENVSDDIIFNHRIGGNVMDKIIVDMADRTALPLEAGVTSGWINGVSAKPGLDIFRVDPHEFDNPTNFYINRVKLAAFERAATSYTIRWQYVDANPTGTVTLFYSATNTGACGPATGIQIGSSVAASTGQATWTFSGLANGTYYICASFSDGTNTNETYAKWPIVVDSGFTNRPNMLLNRSDLNFGVRQRANETFPLFGTSAQTVRVNLTNGSNACWTVDNGLPATYTVTINGTGCGNGSFTIALNSTNPFNVAGLGEATFTVRETVASTIGNSPQSVHSVHRILASSTAPFGSVDTPADNAIVSGSIAVTGWALDDIDITQVAIFRDPVGAEGSAQIFIGFAVRVDDARPDLVAAFPGTPFNYRAGWGYLLLTNFLPGNGDGPYVLHIYATDKEGATVLIGSRAINGANSTATRPFGAIDTPPQGETISGTSYNNFGWVLSRGPHIASPGLSGSASVSVLIDGAAVGSPFGWTNRADLDALFPAATFPGITHAAGVYTFDTTAYANGVHTIAWVVTANNGEADGIGSRYFTIANGSSALTLGQERDRALAAPQPKFFGPDMGRPVAAVGVIAASGPRTVLGEQLGRVVVDGSRPGTTRYDAYLVANGTLSPLPIGASFDDRSGKLYWQPGVGYTGAYDFVVVRDGRERVPVRVVLQPQRVRVPARRGFDVNFAMDASAAGLR